MPYAVEVKRLMPQPTVCVRRVAPVASIGQVMQQSIPLTWGYAASHGHPPSAVFARYFSVDPQRAEFEVGVIVDARLEGEGELRAETLPGGEAAYVLYVGPYDGMEPAYRAIEAWIAANGRKSAGAAWEVYLSDPQSEPDPQKWQTEIYWPLE